MAMISGVMLPPNQSAVRTDGHLEKPSWGGTYSEGATLTTRLNARGPFIPDGRLSSPLLCL